MSQHKNPQNSQPSSKAPAQSDEEVTSLAVVRKGGDWAVLTLKTKGDQVIEKSYGSEQVRSSALEEFKVKAAKTFWSSL